MQDQAGILLAPGGHPTHSALTFPSAPGALGVLGDHVLAACPEAMHCLHWPSAGLVQSLPFPADARPQPGQLLHAAQAASGACMCLAGYHLVRPSSWAQTLFISFL